MASSEELLQVGRDLVEVAKLNGLHSVVILGVDGALEVKAAASRAFLVQSSIALVVGLARQYSEEFGFDTQDAIGMVIKELEEKAKLEES